MITTNENAQQVLKLVHDVSGQLLEASRDGKIDVGELLQVALANTPAILAMAGVKQGN